MSQEHTTRAMESYRLAHLIMEGAVGAAVANALAHLRTAADSFGLALQSKRKADCLVELGKLHQRCGTHAEAVPVYEEALRIYRDLEERQLAAYAGLLAGIALKELNRHDQAVSYLERALEINRDGGDTTHIARTLLVLGNVLLDRGDHAGAVARLGEAQPLLERFDKHAELAHLHEQLALAQAALGNAAAAEAAFTAAVTARQGLGNLRGAAKVMVRQADFRLSIGDLQGAEKLQRQALAVHEMRGDRGLQAQSLGNLGALADRRGNRPAALDLLRRCLDLCRQTGEKAGAVQALHNLACIHLDAGDRVAAITALDEAATLAEELGNHGMAVRSLETLAELRRTAGDVAGELAVQRRLVAALAAADTVAELARARLDLAGLLARGGDRGAARTELIQAVADAEEADDQAVLLHVLDDLGHLAVEAEHWDEAADHHERAAVTAAARGGGNLALRWYNLGLIHQRRTDLRSAAEAWQKSLAEPASGDATARTRRQLGSARHQLGETVAALDLYDEAIQWYEEAHDRRGLAQALVGRGNALAVLDRTDEARAALEHAATIKEELGDQHGTALIRRATSSL